MVNIDISFHKCPTTPVATRTKSLYCCCRLQRDDLPRLRREGRGGHGDLILAASPRWEGDVAAGGSWHMEKSSEFMFGKCVILHD